jgi:adenosylcobyric acid synthase
MGVTEVRGPGQPALAIRERNGEPARLTDGWVAPGGRVWGAYVHGLFDSDAFRRAFLASIGQVRGLSPPDGGNFSWQAFQEEQLDRLAETVRRHLDMAKIRTLLRAAF